MLGKALGFPSQQPLITVSHLLLARAEPFPKTVVMLSPRMYRALVALNTCVSAALWLCPVPALLTERSRTWSWFGSVEDNRCWLDVMTNPNLGDSGTPLCVTQGLASGGGCPLAWSSGMCLSARLSERGWIYGLSTKVLKFSKVATTFFLHYII